MWIYVSRDLSSFAKSFSLCSVDSELWLVSIDISPIRFGLHQEKRASFSITPSGSQARDLSVFDVDVFAPPLRLILNIDNGDRRIIVSKKSRFSQKFIATDGREIIGEIFMIVPGYHIRCEGVKRNFKFSVSINPGAFLFWPFIRKQSHFLYRFQIDISDAGQVELAMCAVSLLAVGVLENSAAGA